MSLKEQRQKLYNELRGLKFDDKKTKEILNKIRKIELQEAEEEKQNKIKSIENECINIEKVMTLFPQIEEVLKKYNNKTSSKRLDTDLKKIDSSLYFEKRYNSWIIEHYGYKINIIHACITSSYNDGIEQNGVINSELAINGLKTFIEYNTKKIKEAREQIKIIDDLINESKEIKEQINS